MLKPSKICARLKVVVKDKHGKVLGERVKDNDLILNNFRNGVLKGLFGAISIAEGGVDMATIAGDTETFWPWRSSTSNWTYSSTPSKKIKVGSGTTAPARTDFKLEDEKGETTAVSVSVGNYYVTYAATIVLATGADITEAGYALYFLDHDLNWQWVLFLRDTFTAITVPNGGSISITYKITI